MAPPKRTLALGSLILLAASCSSSGGTAETTTADGTDTSVVVADAAAGSGDDTSVTADTVGENTTGGAASADEASTTTEAPVIGASPSSVVDPADEPDENADPDAEEALFPDVLGFELVADADGTWTVAATISSIYDTPERYADGFRVLDPDGTVLGEHMLAHDHAGEQPFTRSMAGLVIPDGIEMVTVEGRDQISGYGGDTVSKPVPR